MRYPLLDIFLTMMWFFLWVVWIVLLFWVVRDVFRSHDLSGLGKAGWLCFVVVLPFLGVFTYLIVRGTTMAERDPHAARAPRAAAPGYVKDEDGLGSGDELAKLADLRASGVITEAEFQRGKDKLLG